MPDDLNPYASPAPIPHDHAPQPVDRLGPLRGPSIGLLLSSGLVVTVGGFTFLLDTLERLISGLTMRGPEAGDVFLIVMYLASVPIFVGAINMRYGTRYRWAYAAAVIASIPMLTPLFCWGLPFGIWALIVLHRRDVKAAFAAIAAKKVGVTD